MFNTSGVFPVGTRVLVRPLPAERKTAGGIIITEASARSEEQRQVKAHVIAVGPDAWYDKPSKAWAKVGDLVYIAKFAGAYIQGEDGDNYRLINDEDIGAVLVGGSNGW